jgi:SAM-dependent methyltransferase
VEGAYATVKGLVRTAVLHRQLLAHLPQPPARILDVGGGAGNQSFPLAAAGYGVTLLEPSGAMMARAGERARRLAPDSASRVSLVQADGLAAVEAVEGRTFDAVLCHGVLGYLDDPAPMVEQLCQCTAPGGLVSVMTANAATMAVRPALEGRWADALAAFDATSETGVLGVPSRGDRVEDLSALMSHWGVGQEAWYGVWLFVDWLEFSGVDLGLPPPDELARIVEAEYQAARRDPYRALSRVFHLIGRRPRDGGSP